MRDPTPGEGEKVPIPRSRHLRRLREGAGHVVRPLAAVLVRDDEAIVTRQHEAPMRHVRRARDVSEKMRGLEVPG